MSRWWALIAFVAGFIASILIARHGFKTLLRDNVIVPGPNATDEIRNQATQATNQ